MMKMMKITFLILIIALIGCNKPQNTPQPKEQIDPFIAQEQIINKTLYQKDYERGLKQLELMIFQMEEKKHPIPYRLRLLQGELLYLNLKKAPEAEKIFQKLKRDYPQKIKIHDYLIELSKLNKNKDLIPLMKQRLARQFDEVLFFELVQHLKGKRYFQEALNQLRKHPLEKKQYYLLKLEILLGLKDEVNLQKYFNELLKIYPSGTIRDEILLKRSFHFEGQKQYRPALEAIQMIQDPKLIPLRDRKMIYYKEKLKFLKK